jgi:hypothetical protein
MKVQENQAALKLIGSVQVLDYADDVNVFGDDIDTIKKNVETSWSRSKQTEQPTALSSPYTCQFHDISIDVSKVTACDNYQDMLF